MSNSATACNVSRSEPRPATWIGLCLLLAVALTECFSAGLLYSAAHSASRLVFLLCTLALLVAVVLSVRERSNSVLLAVQSAAAAALLALFWAGSNQVHGGLSVQLGHSTYELTLTLAGLLFIALLLARLLRRSPVEQACKCG